MIDLNTINKIFLAQDTTDLRLGINGYSMIIQGFFHKNQFNNSRLLNFKIKDLVKTLTRLLKIIIIYLIWM